jgi:hypothetical protein
MLSNVFLAYSHALVNEITEEQIFLAQITLEGINLWPSKLCPNALGLFILKNLKRSCEQILTSVFILPNRFLVLLLLLLLLFQLHFHTA